jgi:hypothetical protein
MWRHARVEPAGTAPCASSCRAGPTGAGATGATGATGVRAAVGRRLSRLAGVFHRVGPHFTACPSALAENPYQRPVLGPRFGSTLWNLCLAAAMRSGGAPPPPPPVPADVADVVAPSSPWAPSGLWERLPPPRVPTGLESQDPEGRWNPLRLFSPGFFIEDPVEYSECPSVIPSCS